MTRPGTKACRMWQRDLAETRLDFRSTEHNNYSNSVRRQRTLTLSMGTADVGAEATHAVNFRRDFSGDADSPHSRLLSSIMGILHHRRASAQLGHDEEMARLGAVESFAANGIEESSAQTRQELPWTPRAVVAAATICLGTSVSTLFMQRVSNAVPQYFYAVAIVSPILGFLCYTAILLYFEMFDRRYRIQSQEPLQQNDHSSTSTNYALAQYTCGIGGCFALHNILVDYGRSGTADGHADVSAVLSLILLKLVVPVSLGLESLLERQVPTWNQLGGVAVFFVGIVAAAERPASAPSDETATQGHLWKILSLIASSLPLALGFYVVKMARRRLPQVSGLRLWQVLCLPELVFSIILAFFSLRGEGTSSAHTAAELYHGVRCVLWGFSTIESQCRSASRGLWAGLPFGLALNVSIPVLIQLKGSSTSVPLFRAMALPIAALLAMTGWIVESSPFAWEVVIGVLVCSMGLVLFYGLHNR